MLGAIAYSLNVSFAESEVAKAKTFGEFCDIIAAKISRTDMADCTTQQAFYKLRSAFNEVLQENSTTINSATQLSILLRWNNRRRNVKQLESVLGFPIDLLQPTRWLTTGILIILLTGLAMLTLNWITGLEAIIGAIVMLRVAFRYGKRLDVRSVGELAEKIAIQHYYLCRRNPTTYNKTEVEHVIRKLFADMLGWEEDVFTREAVFA